MWLLALVLVRLLLVGQGVTDFFETSLFGDEAFFEVVICC